MLQRDPDPRFKNLDDTLAAFGLLNAHELLLEIVWANALATYPPAVAEIVVEQLLAVSRRGYGELTVDPDHIERGRRIAEVAEAFTERLVRKAQRRAAELCQARRPVNDDTTGGGPVAA
ncbi:MAG: hypothetical protein AB7O63_13195 [Reyranellaceae bacterium]